MAAATLETRVEDLLTVLDAVGSQRPILAAAGPTGAMYAPFCATHPDRVSGYVWNSPSARAAWAPDYPWGGGPDLFERKMKAAEIYGSPEHIAAFVELMRQELDDPANWDETTWIKTCGRIIRNTATPDAAADIERMWWDTDVRGVPPSIQAPVSLMAGTRDQVEEAKYLATLIPNATVTVVSGHAGQQLRPFIESVRSLAGLRHLRPRSRLS